MLLNLTSIRPLTMILTRCSATHAGLHFTYPRDKRRALEQAAAERGSASAAAGHMQDGAEEDPERGRGADISPRLGPSAAVDGTEMSRLIKPHSHERIAYSDA